MSSAVELQLNIPPLQQQWNEKLVWSHPTAPPVPILVPVPAPLYPVLPGPPRSGQDGAAGPSEWGQGLHRGAVHDSGY